MAWRPPFDRDTYDRKKASTMSHDRVHFTLTGSLLRSEPVRKCAVETLGLDIGVMKAAAQRDECLHIICRPSQFARFVILRFVKYGEPNNMSCLHMRLVVPPKETQAIDVSKIPNTAGESGERL